MRPNGGVIKVAVFTSPEQFLNPTAAAQAFELPPSAQRVTASLTLSDVCAIAVFQDMDGNGRLTTNRLGIPSEPCGFSNNVVIKRGPPVLPTQPCNLVHLVLPRPFASSYLEERQLGCVTRTAACDRFRRHPRHPDSDRRSTSSKPCVASSTDCNPNPTCLRSACDADSSEMANRLHRRHTKHSNDR